MSDSLNPQRLLFAIASDQNTISLYLCVTHYFSRFKSHFKCHLWEVLTQHIENKSQSAFILLAKFFIALIVTKCYFLVLLLFIIGLFSKSREFVTFHVLSPVPRPVILKGCFIRIHFKQTRKQYLQIPDDKKIFSIQNSIPRQIMKQMED